jgi:endonuclease YncB( thermonuclease family)
MPPLADQTDVRHQTLFLATLIVLAIGVVGCKRMSFKNNKEIPAKLRDVAPTTLRGKLHRAWGGDNFEVGQKNQLHYFLLVGVDCPEPGQPYYNQSCEHLVDVCSDREIELEIESYDQYKREIGHAWVTDADGTRINLALDLLSRGLGWHPGSTFAGSDQYRKAMESARERKIGLWSQPNPMPPWEHWKRTQDAVSNGK